MPQPWTSRSGSHSSLKFLVSWAVLLKWNSTYSAIVAHTFLLSKNQVLKLLHSLPRMENARLTSNLAFWECIRGPEDVSLFSSLISFLGKAWWPEWRRQDCSPRILSWASDFRLPIASLQAVVSEPLRCRWITRFPVAIMHSLFDSGCYRREGNCHR